MPIFQDPDRQRFYDLWSDDHCHREHHGHEEHGDDSPWDYMPSWNGFGYSGCEYEGSNSNRGFLNLDHSRAPGRQFPKLHTGDREELIQYLKSAGSSTWLSDHLV